MGATKLAENFFDNDVVNFSEEDIHLLKYF